MTGIADFYLYIKRPYSKDLRKRFLAHFANNLHASQPTRFVILSWKRTGSNLLCGLLHRHPEVTMHNELFNPIDIFTYHPSTLRSYRNQSGGGGSPETHGSSTGWTVLTRDLFSADFLDFIYRNQTVDGDPINPNCRAIGFKSFPEHWIDVRNEPVWQEYLLQDFRVKKIILHREDELAVFVSMKRADLTGRYLTHKYPDELQVHIDPAEFQTFLNNYRNTFQCKYKSPVEKRDTFWMTYEQLVDSELRNSDIIPKLCKFLGIEASQELQPLKETVKQADPEEDLSKVISNYEELEFCF